MDERSLPQTPTFKQDSISHILAHSMHDKLKVSTDVAALVGEYLRVFVLECASRASEVAAAQEERVVGPQHLEKILAQLLLDFA
eukprot:m.49467 g.49467  ORF g.49467 m.49467 type:complete len:84 (+) comp47955_c0_seq1:1-252(+)